MSAEPEFIQSHLHARRRFVPRADFAATSRSAPDVCLDSFRADQDVLVDDDASDERDW